MINPQTFYDKLKGAGISFFTGVPDSLLKNICAYIEDNASKEEHVIAANEGNALSLGIGYHIATGKFPFVYMQNSGLGNIVNPLISLADPEVYSIPMLLMIGWRGEPGVKDEPQHKKQGRITLKMLDVMEVPYEILTPEMNDEALGEIMLKANRHMQEKNAPFALVVKKGSFAGYKLKNSFKANFPLLREDAIKILVDNIEDDAIVVSTTGVASRELFEYREELKQGHDKDFLTVGGMGHANQIALGIAMQEPARAVYCLDGDGAMLMHMGSLAINASMKCKNYRHILLNNGAHDSVGGQPTIAYGIDTLQFARAVGYDWVEKASTAAEISEAILRLQQHKGTGLLDVRVNKGFRSNLGRPSTTPQENKISLMEFIANK